MTTPLFDFKTNHQIVKICQTMMNEIQKYTSGVIIIIFWRNYGKPVDHQLGKNMPKPMSIKCKSTTKLKCRQ